MIKPRGKLEGITMKHDETNPTRTSRDSKQESGVMEPEAAKEAGREPKKGRDVKDLLKNARRRGITQKGQQGVIEFDYPRKKE